MEKVQSTVLCSLEGPCYLSRLHDGEQSVLASGPISLELVPVSLPPPSSLNAPSSGSASPSPANSKPPSPVQDDWLVLRVGTDFELPLPSITSITVQGNLSYIWPYIDLNNPPPPPSLPPRPSEKSSQSDPFAGYTPAQPTPSPYEGNGYIKLQLASNVSSHDKELFELILNQRCAVTNSEISNNYKSKIVLVDEPSGQIVGDLSSCNIHKDDDLKRQESLPVTDKPIPGSGLDSKEPVVIELNESTSDITLSPLSKAEERAKDSKIVAGAVFISRGLLYASSMASNGLQNAADSFTTKTKGYETPMEFKPRTHAFVGKIGSTSGKAAEISGKTIGYITTATGQLSERMGKKTAGNRKPGKEKKPGFFNNSFVAFSTVLDSAEQSGKMLLQSVSESSTKAVGHRYGPEAEQISRTIGNSGQNVALVYIDARGVSRKALMKTAGKSFFKARMSDGREVVLGDEGKNNHQAIPPPSPSPSPQPTTKQ